MEPELITTRLFSSYMYNLLSLNLPVLTWCSGVEDQDVSVNWNTKLQSELTQVDRVGCGLCSTLTGGAHDLCTATRLDEEQLRSACANTMRTSMFELGI